jgi:hypothetical protein
MSDNLTNALIQLALALLSVATLAITVYVIPWLRGKVGQDRLNIANDIAAAAVRAVQQTMKDHGAEFKYAAALDYARTVAARRGVKIDDDTWNGLIEAAVHDLRVVMQSVDAPPLPTLDGSAPDAPTIPTPTIRGPQMYVDQRQPRNYGRTRRFQKMEGEV